MHVFPQLAMRVSARHAVCRCHAALFASALLPVYRCYARRLTL